jgi:hypothetical protein
MIEQACTMTSDASQPVEYQYDRTILLLADSVGVRERMRRAAGRAGYRVSGAASLAEAGERLDRQVAVNAVAVQLDERARGRFAPLLARLDAGAREGRHASIVAGPAAMIDELAASLCHRDIYHLCEPSRADWLDALAEAAAPRPLRLSDINKESGGPRLQQLSEEVGRIATILASLSDPEEGAAPDPGPGTRNASRRIQAGQIRSIIRARRMRDQFFKGDLFADPAWDMLLDLMAARLEQRRVAVSSLCIAAAVPPTTALRWIKTLCEQGLFVRVADPQDGRRVFIELSDATAASLDACLRSAQRISPLIM